MDVRKLEPGFGEAMKHIEALGMPPEERLTVGIQLARRVGIPRTRSRREQMEMMSQVAQEVQGPVLEQLGKLGIDLSEVRQEPLSNSIFASLTLDQIARVTELPEVQMIRLVRPAHVALS